MFLEKRTKSDLIYHDDDGKIIKTSTIEQRVLASINDFDDSIITSNNEGVNRSVRKLTQGEKGMLKDLESLYWKSFNELEKVFDNEFKASNTFKDMVLQMN